MKDLIRKIDRKGMTTKRLVELLLEYDDKIYDALEKFKKVKLPSMTLLPIEKNGELDSFRVRLKD